MIPSTFTRHRRCTACVARLAARFIARFVARGVWSALAFLLTLIGGAAAVVAQVVPPASAAALERRISVTYEQASIGEALMVLRHTHRVPLAWSGDVLPASVRVSLRATDMPVREVLDRIVSGAGLRVVVTEQGAVVVVPNTRAIAEAPNATAEPTALPDIARTIRATGVQQLDQVVVMGSSVRGGPEREQPTAVRVVDAMRLQEVGAPRLTDAMRMTMPGLVMWDRGPTGPPPPFAAMRGVASFTTRAVKTYIDGIEVASPELFTLLDGRSVQQLEMIRGPQGAALYGPDALNGILQITTRHGTPGATRWAPRWHVGGGRYDRADLATARPVLDVATGVTAATARMSVDISGAFAQAGSDSATRDMRSWNLHGGATAAFGSVVINTSARAAAYEFSASRLAAAERSPEVPQHIQERGVAVTISQQLTDRWRHAVIAGGHWIRGDREPFRSPLLPPRLPGSASFERAHRVSARYANTFDVSPAFEVSTGAEYSERTADRERVRSTLLYDLTALYTNTLRSAGAFGQARLRVGSHVTLSGGVRGEQLSSVGARLGTVWASTAGMSWTHAVGGTTVRGRVAWGRGIRPPEPGMKIAQSTAVLRQLPNPNLAPERQQGVEFGADLFAANGAFMKTTWYLQTASDLLQQVSRRTSGTPVDAYQFQNVGVIRNRGVELDAGWQGSRLTAGVSVQRPRSRVHSLSPFYTGELRPGDMMIEVPEASGAAYVRVQPRRVLRQVPRWTAEVGTTVLGPWTGYDWLLLARIERGQATRRDLVRDYWLRYEGVVRPYVSASVRLWGEQHAVMRIDNPANTSSFVRDNAGAPLGRVITLGVERMAR
ncbi:MAG: TonB-dependent receptor [Gemmatimonadaceae bacterium]|nr:TonB-dependent receptor [Gemmatimonadaceae bacterium]